MKLVVIGSSSFSDKELFDSTIKDYSADEYIVKAKSDFATWIPEATTFTKYNDLVIEDDMQILAFWDGESLNVKRIVEAYPEKSTIVTFENKAVKSFYDMVEQIKNEKWKEGCRTLIKKLPNYFWVVAASSSGKYHPKCDLGSGGLVRHSVMVAIAAVDLVRAEIFVEDNDLNADMALIAGLFHDCLKQGKDCTGHTVFEHPELAAEFLNEELKDYIEEPYLSIICGGVKTHMGKWTTSDYAPDVILEKPSTAFQKLVHTADYVAARKYISGLEEWQ